MSDFDTSTLPHWTKAEATRRGGLIGQARRNVKLSPKRRSAIARKAGKARWRKKDHELAASFGGGIVL